MGMVSQRNGDLEIEGVGAGKIGLKLFNKRKEDAAAPSLSKYTGNRTVYSPPSLVAFSHHHHDLQLHRPDCDNSITTFVLIPDAVH